MGAGASFTLGRLADALGASRLGDAARMVTGGAPLEPAGPEHVSFLTDRRYLQRVREVEKRGRELDERQA